jgi:hypothetical protein
MQDTDKQMHILVCGIPSSAVNSRSAGAEGKEDDVSFSILMEAGLRSVEWDLGTVKACTQRPSMTTSA